jgi:DNA-binding response OmpR family regulator
MPGVDVIKAIREADGIESRFEPGLTIIVLTRKGDGGDRARSIQLGTDEYLHKPFTYDELKVRIKAVLRRRHSRHDSPTRVGEIHIDPGRRKVTVGDREVHLAKEEFVLLRILATDPTRVFSKDLLLRDVWGFKVPAGRTRTLDSHASRPRRKLDPGVKMYVVNCWASATAWWRRDLRPPDGRGDRRSRGRCPRCTTLHGRWAAEGALGDLGGAPPFRRTGRAEAGEGPAHTPRVRRDPAARQRAGDNLAEELTTCSKTPRSGGSPRAVTRRCC